MFLFLRSGPISMGLLTVGTPLEWSEMVKWQDHVRKFGVKQFIRTYNRLKVQRIRPIYRAGHSFIGFLSESLVICKKNERRSDLLKKLAIRSFARFW